MLKLNVFEMEKDAVEKFEYNEHHLLVISLPRLGHVIDVLVTYMIAVQQFEHRKCNFLSLLGYIGYILKTQLFSISYG